MINHLGRLFVTSDAATIIREIEVVHPAAKLLVMASQAQEEEVRMNSVFLFSWVLNKWMDVDGRCDQYGAHPCRRAAEKGGEPADHGPSPK